MTGIDAVPQLIATDLDGTLVPAGTVAVPKYTASVLRDADRAGIPVVFVTGRVERWMQGFWPHVGRHGYAILANGAVTLDVRHRRVIDVHGIHPRLGRAIVARLHDALPTAAIAVEVVDGQRIDLHPTAPSQPDGFAEWKDRGIKILVKAPRVEPGALRSIVDSTIAGVATATWSISGLVEISALGVTKALALRRLASELGVDRTDVIAFGDMPNDVPMLDWAGRAYAVADAHPSVTAVADRIIPAAADEGVAKEIARLLTIVPTAPVPVDEPAA
jgi:HAD superfamily hydrolase (TIGR01484 family)